MVLTELNPTEKCWLGQYWVVLIADWSLYRVVLIADRSLYRVVLIMDRSLYRVVLIADRLYVHFPPYMTSVPPLLSTHYIIYVNIYNYNNIQIIPNHNDYALK